MSLHQSLTLSLSLVVLWSRYLQNCNLKTLPADISSMSNLAELYVRSIALLRSCLADRVWH